MPAIVGAIKINAMGSSAVFNIGDVFTISPVSSAKTFAGAGSFNTGDNLNVRNEHSTTNTYDKDFADGNISTIL
ncbi:spore germination protein [Anaerobacillus alkaliphilus]|uniref:Spore germination protein n=1 Tax=Anaerobacillus alkaliphilus TaxID=1548597 RepID=A0A4V1LG17_9BACI|nr:spore germination protein [Anaerobacillus alkaliphilus]RXI98204.1 spore germination protein [Anaerobacillus alkaliphilus]